MEEKRLKRILKELGIYSAFIRERRKYILKKNVYYTNFFGTQKSFAKTLQCAFIWADTENEKAWQELNNLAYSVENDIISVNEKTLMKLNKIISNL